MNDDFLEERFAKVNLTDWLKIYSRDIWNRLEFCLSRNDVKVYETTITQNLLYDIYRFQRLKQNCSIRLLEAKNEKVNGNDIEIFVQKGDKYLFFPTQAKSIYPSGKYQQIRHKTANKRQVDSLLEYADEQGGVPLYLMYNYYFGEEVKFIKKSVGCRIEDLGCSLINANYIYDKYFSPFASVVKGLPSFCDFHPYPAVPLFFLAKLTEDKDALSRICNDDISVVRKLKEYTREEVFDNKAWNDLTPIAGRLSGIDIQGFDILRERKTHEFTYSAKYRLIISNEPDTLIIRVLKGTGSVPVPKINSI